MKTYQTKKELKSVLNFSSDYKVIKHLNYPLYEDLKGTLRFLPEDMSKKELFDWENLNNTWCTYHKGTCTLRYIIGLYMKGGISVDGFFSAFSEIFDTITYKDLVLALEGE